MGAFSSPEPKPMPELNWEPLEDMLGLAAEAAPAHATASTAAIRAGESDLETENTT